MDSDQTFSLCLYVAQFCEHLLEDCHPPFKKLFVAFPWVVTSTGPGGFMMCVYYMTGAPKGSQKVVLWRSGESNL